MDDVLRPVFVTITGEKNIRTKLPLAANAVFFLVLGLVLTQAGSTSSYFADSELSSGNTMSAMSFEINASALPEESYVGHSGGSTVVSTITPNPVGFPNEYRVTVEQTGGSAAFCQALRMYSTSTSPFTYEGALLDFNSPPTIFSGDWTFDVRLAPDAISINAEDTCEINLVYSASTWLEEKGVHGGYSDVAKVALEFEASGYHHDESQAESFVTNSIVDSVITSTSTEESSVATSTEETNATSTPPVVGEDNTDATSTPAVVTEEEGEEPDTQETVVEEEVSPAVEESTPPDPAI